MTLRGDIKLRKDITRSYVNILAKGQEKSSGCFHKETQEDNW